MDLSSLSLVPQSVDNVADLLRFRASDDAGSFRFLASDGHVADAFDTAGLLRRAAGVAHTLADLPAGSPVALMHPPGLGYVAAFFGCLLARRSAVPLYPPLIGARDRSMATLARILDDAGARTILTTDSVKQRLGGGSSDASILATRRVIATDRLPEAHDHALPAPGPRDIAVLQYTSGSTGDPRGVRITHENLLANSKLIQAVYDNRRGTTGVSWLPPNHDMGLVGGILQPVYAAFHVVLMAPRSFVENPLSWLRTMTRFRARVSGAPDFAYALCARRAKPSDVQQFDLRAWEVAFCGAEPVRAASLAHFAEVFAEAGFSTAALSPCYGLAETTLIVTGRRRAAGSRTLRADADALAHGRVQVVREGGRELVSCGAPLPGVEVRILGAEDVGEIQVSGPTVAAGYTSDRDADSFDSRGRTVRTGDLGFLHEGELFVVGRLKDVLIVRGKKHHPHDIETSLELAVPELRSGRIMVVGKTSEDGDQVIVLAEPRRAGANLPELATRIRAVVAREHGIDVDVGLLERHGLPKTSSGKPQRRAALRAFVDGRLPLLYATSTPKHQGEGQNAGVLERLLDRTATVLQREPAQISVDAPLIQLGLDSLAATELRHSVMETFEVDVPLTLIARGISLQELAQRIGASMARGEAALESTDADAKSEPAARTGARLPALSLFFFESTEANSRCGPLYAMLERSARFADEHGFEAIWLPERHFHAFGGPFPSPAVLAGALAVQTSHIQLRAGSIVLPLHHPARVAEDWAVVDHLSGGRVGLAFATGWNARDFVLAPNRFEQRLADTFEAIDAVRALWRGERRTFSGGRGEATEIETFPRPLQRTPDVWLTCSESYDRFVDAGQRGFNVLTALLFQDVRALHDRIAAYREAYRAAGHEGRGKVTLGLHTFVGASDAEALSTVRPALRRYLESSSRLWQQEAARLSQATPEQKAAALDYAVERYALSSSLIGGPATCAARLEELAALGVDEVACLIDFGVPDEETEASLQRLAELAT